MNHSFHVKLKQAGDVVIQTLTFTLETCDGDAIDGLREAITSTLANFSKSPQKEEDEVSEGQRVLGFHVEDTPEEDS